MAELYRARAVVHRRFNDNNYGNKDNNMGFSRDYCKKALMVLHEDEQVGESSLKIGKEYVPAHIEKERGLVFANVLFSCGYYLYSRKEYAAASDQFKGAIEKIEATNTHWDPPYTRLAIIQLLENRKEDALRYFNQAIIHCKKTVENNPEAKLSESICELGLSVIELDNTKSIFSRHEIKMKTALEGALSQKPWLSRGPLNCHRKDAAKIEEACICNQAKELVAAYIQSLDDRLAQITRREQLIG